MIARARNSIVAVVAMLAVVACGASSSDAIGTKTNRADGGAASSNEAGTDMPVSTIDAGDGDECAPSGPEVCDGKDNDCNGAVDDGLPQSTDSCSVGVGACARTGHKTCVNGAMTGCSATPGAPTVETCDGVDTDCDGQLDPPTCTCVDGATQACGKSSLGSCKMGTQSCSAGQWQPCVGNIDPKDTDSCAKGNDDNCDGIVTNGPIPNDVCKCLDGATSDCATIYNLKSGCAKASLTCAGGSWPACPTAPAAHDTCANGDDSDCDGAPTSNLHLPPGCACALNATPNVLCSNPPYNAKGKCAITSARCDPGTANSVMTSVVDCGPLPGAVDTCVYGSDENCNNVPNEGCVCLEGSTTRACTDTGNGICAGGSQTCTNGKTGAYGACTAVAGTVGRTHYCFDGDGDGYCAATAAEGEHCTYACSNPGAGWILGTACLGTDAYDANPYEQSGPIAQELPHVVTWDKGWGDGCETKVQTYTCSLGEHMTSCTVTKKSGGGNWAFIGQTSVGQQTGGCEAEICDSGTSSAGVNFVFYCNIYGATQPW